MTSVDLFFDPNCPFTWRTSRWLTELADADVVDVTWRVMSLAILHEDRDIPAEWQEIMAQSTRALRVLAAVEDNTARGRLYSALGTRKHEKGLPYTDAEIAAAVADAGLPASVAAAVDDAGLDAAVRASHEEGQAAVGQESGSPIVRLGPRAWFGPVLAGIPTGEEARKLFEAIRLLAEVPTFSELKTSRRSPVTG